MARDTSPSQDASTHQILDSYLKEFRRYTTDTRGTDEGTDSAITIHICLQMFLWGIKTVIPPIFITEIIETNSSMCLCCVAWEPIGIREHRHQRRRPRRHFFGFRIIT